MKRPTEHHPRFGDILLVERHPLGPNGKQYSWYEYDPRFEPKLPRHAVRGDVTRQQYCTAHHVPKYYYLDEEKTCVQCRAELIFSANRRRGRLASR